MNHKPFALSLLLTMSLVGCGLSGDIDALFAPPSTTHGAGVHEHNDGGEPEVDAAPVVDAGKASADAGDAGMEESDASAVDASSDAADEADGGSDAGDPMDAGDASIDESPDACARPTMNANTCTSACDCVLGMECGQCCPMGGGGGVECWGPDIWPPPCANVLRICTSF